MAGGLSKSLRSVTVHALALALQTQKSEWSVHESRPIMQRWSEYSQAQRSENYKQNTSVFICLDKYNHEEINHEKMKEVTSEHSHFVSMLHIKPDQKESCLNIVYSRQKGFMGS